MDKIKNLSDKEILKEFNRVSQNKKSLGKNNSPVKEKKKIDYNIFEKPKKPQMSDFLSLETLKELHDWIRDKECRQSIKRWMKKYNKDDTSSSSEDSD
jgi:hypothetical protein